MYKIHFYKKANGKIPIVDDFLNEISHKGNKDNRIRLNKFYEYMTVLSNAGLSAGEPYIKPLGNGLWELRPISDRVLFVAWVNGSFIILHHFLKKTNKTPKKEIDKALREIEDIKKGKIKYE